MNKKDLKNRMVAKLANGQMGIIVDNYIMFGLEYLELSQYNEDLTIIRDDFHYLFDIIEVYDCTCTLDFLFYVKNDLELIWKRN